MTDRESLELAARAVGKKIDVKSFGEYQEAHRGFLVADGDHWNPLNDDGDALRLLASMREKFGSILLAIFEDRVECGDVNYCQSIEDIVDGNIPCAIRRAITRAAAEMEMSKGKDN